MAITESDIDPRGQLRFMAHDGIEVLIPGEDLDGVLTATALAVGELQPDGVFVAEPSPPTTGPWHMVIPVRPTLTQTVGATLRILWEGYNHLGEFRRFLQDKTNTNTTSRVPIYFSVITKIEVQAFGSAGNLSIGMDHQNQLPIPIPFVPRKDQAANEIGDVAGATFLDAGGGTYSLNEGEGTGAFTTDRDERTMTFVNTVTAAATQPIRYRIIPDYRAEYRGDMPR